MITDQELEAVKKDFPSWRYGSICTTVATRAGPPRKVTASRDGILVVAETEYELRQKLQHEESRPGGV